MTATPPTLLDRPHAFLELFAHMEMVLRRLDEEFPELDNADELSGADAVDRITAIRAEAKDALKALDQLSAGDNT